MKILLVEDESFMQDAMASVIEDTETEVLKASDLNEAMSILENNHVDLLITDIYLPQPQGVELINHIKSNPVTANVPVIVVTGCEHDSVNIEAKIDMWLTKPFTLQDLKSAIRKYAPVNS